MLNTRNLATLLLAVTMLAATSCRKNRHIEQLREVEYEISDLSADSLFISMAESYGEWHDIHAPVTIVVEEPSPFSISGRITMVRDSAIYISLRAMGMEVAVIYADADSIYAVDKYNKMYVAERLASVLPRTCLDISNLQDMLTGRAFMPGGSTITEASLSDFSLRRRPDTFTFTPAATDSNIEWMFRAIASNPAVLSDIAIADPAGILGGLTYGNFEETEAGTMASAAVLTANISGYPVLASFTTGIEEMRLDTYRTIRFRRPSPEKFRRIPGNQLIRLFEQ